MRPSVPCRFPQRQIEPALLRNSLAHPSALLISAHMSLKGDLSPFSVGFLHTAFAPPEVSVGDKAVRNRRKKSSLSREWRQGKKKSDHLWMQRWCFSSIPLTGFVPCVKPKQGTSKEILSLLCPTSVDSNIQMTFKKINRGQGLALECWQWHPRQDHGERGQTQRKLAVLGFPSCSVPLPPWAVEFFPYWTSDGRRGESGTVYMQALSSQGPSKPFCQCLS